MIPEFLGRLSVVATLDEQALVKVLTEPKNALIKQYQRLMDMENVNLRFTDSATKAIAKQALIRKLGARGLRSILEDLMLDLMYDVPSQDNIKEIVVSEDTVVKGETPIIVYSNQAETA